MNKKDLRNLGLIRAAIPAIVFLSAGLAALPADAQEDSGADDQEE